MPVTLFQRMYLTQQNAKKYRGFGSHSMAWLLASSNRQVFSRLPKKDITGFQIKVNVRFANLRYPRTPWPGDHPPEVKVTQSYLPPRRPRDSFVSCYIPMSDPAESIRYLNHGGSVRFGRFLEDLDTLAGKQGMRLGR